MMTVKNFRFASLLVLLFFTLSSTLFSSQASARQQLEILDAKYGTRHQSSNVTHIVRKHVRHGSSINIPVNNDTMRGDPSPGRHKELYVRYLENGRERSTRVAENDYLVIGRGGSNNDGGWSGGNKPDHNRGLEIVEAEYGSGGRYWDVSDRVRRHVRGDKISLQVTNDTMGGDPRPNRPKELRVKYREKNKIRRDTIREGDWFTVGSGSGGGWNRPPPNRPDYDDDLEIIRAKYGTDGRYWDVTDRIRSAARRGSVSLRVNNKTMGGDPAPNRPKELQVKYRQDGRKQQTRVREGDWLNIN